MKFLGLRILTERGYHRRLRQEEKDGFKTAMVEFGEANEVHYGTPIIRGNDFDHSKLVILGDGVMVYSCTFEDTEMHEGSAFVSVK